MGYSDGQWGSSGYTAAVIGDLLAAEISGWGHRWCGTGNTSPYWILLYKLKSIPVLEIGYIYLYLYIYSALVAGRARAINGPKWNEEFTSRVMVQ